jgi:hypothetical protein
LIRLDGGSDNLSCFIDIYISNSNNLCRAPLIVFFLVAMTDKVALGELLTCIDDRDEHVRAAAVNALAPHARDFPEVFAGRCLVKGPCNLTDPICSSART